MIQTPSSRTFSYTARRGSFLTMVSVFGALTTIESSVFLVLILVLIPNSAVKWSFAGIVLFLLFLLIGVMLSALFTTHRLTPDHLHLHYGHLLHITLPRSTLKNVQPVRERISPLAALVARYDAKKQRITACFSEQGQILLTLTEPCELKLGRQTKIVCDLLINVDQRDELLTALHSEISPTLLSHIGPAGQQDDIVIILARQLAPSGSSIHRDDTPIAIRVEGLSRRFQQFVAVDQLDMEIRAGEIYGLLGSNGAGKTTTIKMLVGLLTPDAGKIELADLDLARKPEEVKRILGYVADRSLLYERLSGREYLAFLAQVHGLALNAARERIAALLDLLELQAQAERLCGSYSFGMKRKLSLAGVLLHQPRILILDEPLNGLDPRNARRLKDLFRELSAAGTTILLSTHDLAMAEEICHRVGILHKGHLLAEGSVGELRQMAAASDLEAVFLNLTTKEEVSI